MSLKINDTSTTRSKLIRRNQELRHSLAYLKFIEPDVSYDGVALTQIAAETYALESLAEMIGIYTGQPEGN